MAGDPKHFFLNENHELASQPPEGGGRSANIEQPNDWGAKASALRASFDRVVSQPPRTRDPSASNHRFALTIPASLIKVSKSKKEAKTNGRVPFTPSFGGTQAGVLGKLGFDLLSVDAAGNAIVHVATARIPRLRDQIDGLRVGKHAERQRWLNVGDFASVGWTQRVDVEWLDNLSDSAVTDAHLRFYPVLPRAEVGAVLDEIQRLLSPGERLVRTGRDFSGRYWAIAQLRRRTIQLLAEEFPSLQSLHPRLSTPVASSASRGGGATVVPPVPSKVDPSTLPTIGMLDMGVPPDHPILKRYIRNRYHDPLLGPELATVGDHGSQVASALVFGHRVHDRAPTAADFPSPTCRVFDMLGGWTFRGTEVPDELWERAVESVLGTARDIRVFNLSLGGHRLETMWPKEREEKLRYLQDLDNRAYAADLVLVYSAGNTERGVGPGQAYPNHLDEEDWGLGVLAQNHNGLVVGAYVNPAVPRGTAPGVGAPSPFTKIGPGRNNEPVPSFSAPGGDATPEYEWAPGSGVWVFDATGAVMDCAGTSFSAPLVAREAAFTFRDLEPYCPDARPFAATVRAWLTLEARRPATFTGALEKLADRTLGGGFPSAAGLTRPDPGRAVFVWQAVLESSGTVARVSVPVPQDWLRSAREPHLRLVVAWLTPVNAALSSWSCRKVSAQLRTSDARDAKGRPRTPLAGGRGVHHRARGNIGAYPVIDRVYDIHPDRLREFDALPTSDLWILSLWYDELGSPPVGFPAEPQQRVGVVLELRDHSAQPVSPQAAVQALDIAPLNRLSVRTTPISVGIR